MSIGFSSLLCTGVLFLVIITFLLQLIALTTTWWAAYTARVDLGKPAEDGHYGIWTLCSTKGPYWTEDCDPLDTFFQVPSYAQVSGILGIVHLVLLLSFLPVGSLRAIQVVRRDPALGIKPKILCIAKLTITFISAIFATLVAIFISVGESQPREYVIHKSWSFWIQISVILLDILSTMVCVIECIRFWQLHLQHQVDPEGRRAETYGNPVFESGSPNLSDRQSPNGNTISYTESSGRPYRQNVDDFCSYPDTRSGMSQPDRSRIVDESPHRPTFLGFRNAKKEGKKSHSVTLTYENETFQEHSPGASRKNHSLYYA